MAMRYSIFGAMISINVPNWMKKDDIYSMF